MAMLTQKQENFCVEVVATGNATEAYRRAYKADKMSESTINRAAKTLMDDSKISARVSELRAPVIERAQVTLEGHLADLKRLRDAAELAEKYAPAIAAEVARGKAAGLYIEKVEHSGNVTIQATNADEKL